MEIGEAGGVALAAESPARWAARVGLPLGTVARCVLIAAMAGREAEVILCGRARVDDASDLEHVRAVARHYKIGDLERWRAEARRLARRHRGAIELVAAALVRRGRLSAEEVRRIITAAGHNKQSQP